MVETNYNCPCMEKCPLHYVMSVIGGKWKIQILCSLNSNGPLRYNSLRARLDGVSNTVLVNALRELEQNGLIQRHEYLEVPARVEYSTTEACDRLIPILNKLGDWGESMMQLRTEAAK